jgi:peptidoglycan/LPS O-acetylase OafA/YrhL
MFAADAPRMSSPHAKASGPSHGTFVIPSLDGLRAVSFMIVFLGHASVPGMPGGFGVTVFFFLSGYLITTLLRMETAKTNRVDLKAFYVRRALRIWPPFYLVLCLSAVLTLTGVFAGQIELGPVMAQALHYCNYWFVAHSWGGVAGGTGVYWSLAVEEHFYLVFPAFYAFLVRSRMPGNRQQILFFAICAVALLWRAVLVFYFESGIDRTYIASDARLDSMLYGCALAVHGNPMLDAREERRPARDLAFLALGLAALLSSFLIRDPAFRETLRYSLQGIGLYPVFLTAVRYPDWIIYRFLNLKPVRFIGTLSYSLYLVHQVVIICITDPMSYGPVVRGVVALAISLAASTAIWFFVEEPFAELRRRFSASRRSARLAAEPLVDRVPS